MTWLAVPRETPGARQFHPTAHAFAAGVADSGSE